MMENIIMNMGMLLRAIILYLVIIMIYILPTIIAEIKEKENIMSIFILNFLLGWTIIGWIIALIWAFMVENKTMYVFKNNKKEILYRVEWDILKNDKR